VKYLLSLLLLISVYAKADPKQNEVIDSLNVAMATATNDQERIELFIELGDKYSDLNSDSLMSVANQLLIICKKVNDKCGMSSALGFKGYYYYKNSELKEAQIYYKKVLKLRERYCSKKEVASTSFQLANIKSLLGDYDKAYSYYYKCLTIYEEMGDEELVSNVHSNLGLVDISRERYASAKDHYLKGLLYQEGRGASKDLANLYNNMGGMYQAQEIFDTALVNFQKAMSIYREINYKAGLAHGYNNIGIIYYHQDKEDSCMNYFLKSLEIREQIGEKSAISQSYNNIGILYMYQENYSNAISYSKSALKIAREADLKGEISDAYLSLYETYFESGDYHNAVLNLKEFTDYKDTLVSEQGERLISEMETKYETIKKEKEIEKNNIALQQKSASIKLQTQIIWGASFLGFVLIVLLVIVYNRNKLTKQQNKIIVEQKKVVDHKNKEILDSIKYAKRIQAAILPQRMLVKEYLKDSFILYKPKDIVAGDFYWMEHKHDKVLFAAADCTGHGVPGAMVSVVCNNALNRSVREHGLTDPGKILDKSREIVIKEFEKSNEDVNDGMDIALCSLEEKGGKTLLQYAGAHNPLWIVRNNEILETKANKQPIGKFANKEPYTTHTFELEKGDSIYIFSDGYVDQFGGEKGKKLKAKSFKELIISIQDKEMEEQKLIINEVFETWKGDLEQIDDVCVIGVRI